MVGPQSSGQAHEFRGDGIGHSLLEWRCDDRCRLRLKTAFEKRIEQEAEGFKAARARPGLGGRGTGRCRPVVDLAATPQLERLASQRRSAGPVRPDATPVDAAIVRAVSLALQGRLDEAARLCGDAPRGTQLQARRHGCCRWSRSSM